MDISCLGFEGVRLPCFCYSMWFGMGGKRVKVVNWTGRRRLLAVPPNNICVISDGKIVGASC